MANIGEEIEEVEVIPLTQPVTPPATVPVPQTPVEEPDRELQPA